MEGAHHNKAHDDEAAWSQEPAWRNGPRWVVTRWVASAVGATSGG